jgi:acetyltransferase-like isoleucine patch superfamily enzyme
MKFTSQNVYISPRARIGQNVRIGDNATIYDNVELGDNTVIGTYAIVGEPLMAYYHHGVPYENPPTIIGRDSIIRSHSVVYAGCTIDEAFSCGHHTLIREASKIGAHCSLGSFADLEGCAQIGNYCRLHSNVHVSQQSALGDFVWMFPFSVIANDPYPPSHDIQGSYIGNYTQVCVHAVVLAGVRIGENCMVGAHSLVNKNLPDFSLASGNPLTVRDIRKYSILGKGHVYPWMTRFDRGMPWEGIGYEEWSRLNTSNVGSK